MEGGTLSRAHLSILVKVLCLHRVGNLRLQKNCDRRASIRDALGGGKNSKIKSDWPVGSLLLFRPYQEPAFVSIFACKSHHACYFIPFPAAQVHQTHLPIKALLSMDLPRRYAWILILGCVARVSEAIILDASCNGNNKPSSPCQWLDLQLLISSSISIAPGKRLHQCLHQCRRRAICPGGESLGFGNQWTGRLAFWSLYELRHRPDSLGKRGQYTQGLYIR